MRRFGNRRTTIGGQFAPHTIEMLRSPAWCALSLSARRILDRLEIEMADHGGTDNGRLPVTYDDFCRYGIHRHAIGPAIREAAALGFLEITEAGRAGCADFRKPNRFRITYRHTKNQAPTDEWKRIGTDKMAAELKIQCRKTPKVSDENQHRKRQIHSTETVTTGHSAETITTIDISGGNDAAPTSSSPSSDASPQLAEIVRARGWTARG
jgi:hypothetical protein